LPIEDGVKPRVIARLLDESDHPYDFFIGEAAECPPIPRVGERVLYRSGIGEVTEVLYVYEDIPISDSYRIAVRLKQVA
jgi:hypothetical protein